MSCDPAKIYRVATGCIQYDRVNSEYHKVVEMATIDSTYIKLADMQILLIILKFHALLLKFYLIQQESHKN